MTTESTKHNSSEQQPLASTLKNKVKFRSNLFGLKPNRLKPTKSIKRVKSLKPIQTVGLKK